MVKVMRLNKYFFIISLTLLFGVKKIHDKPVVVLGGGAGGQAMAADLALAGMQVRLYELQEFEESVENIMKDEKIEIIGEEANARNFKRRGIAKLDLITTNMEDALEGVELINLVVPAIGHEKFFEKIIPYLTGGEIVNIFPDNFSSLLLKQKLREKNIDIDIMIGGWSSLPYACRRRGVESGKIELANRTVKLRGDTLPSKDWNKFLRVMRDFPPFDHTEIEKGDTMLDIGLSNPNPVVHVPGSVLNVAQMENYGRPEKIYGDEKANYSLYIQGTSPSVAKVMIEFYKEECQIADAIGINIADYPTS